MPEIELDINYLVSCIESINQISSIPAAEGLKQVVNRWVDEKTDEALADPAVRVQTFSIWKKLTGDVDSERLVEVIATLPNNELSEEIRQFFLDRVNHQLDEAMKDPANKMLFFRSWLASSAVPSTENGVEIEEPKVDQGTVDEAGSAEHDTPHHIW
jgi:hypothetical protein